MAEDGGNSKQKIANGKQEKTGGRSILVGGHEGLEGLGFGFFEMYLARGGGGVGVVAVAGCATGHDASLFAVALAAALHGGHEDVGGFLAAPGLVAFGATHVFVFGMVEDGAAQPAVGGDGGLDHGFVGGLAGDLVAVGAAGEARAAFVGHPLDGTGGAFLGVAEEDLLGQVVAGTDVLPEGFDLAADVGFECFVVGDALGAAFLGVLDGEAGEVGLDGFGAAVGDGEVGVAGIELEGMAGLAIFLEDDGLHVGPGGVGLVAVVAVEFLAVDLRDAVATKVEGVVEGEGVGVAAFFAVDLPGGVVFFERGEDGGRGGGAAGLVVDVAVAGGEVEGRGGLVGGGGVGCGHGGGVAVAGGAVGIGHGFHGSGGEVFVVAGGAGMRARGLGGVEVVVLVALDAGGIDG